MESITKNRQPVRALRAMVARAYGPGQVPAAGEDWVSELGDGWFNVAYRIRLRDGSRVVLKIAPPPAVEAMTYERGALPREPAGRLRAMTGGAVPAGIAEHRAERAVVPARRQHRGAVLSAGIAGAATVTVAGPRLGARVDRHTDQPLTSAAALLSGRDPG